MDLDFIEFIERKSRFKNNMRYMMTSRQIEYVPGKEGVGWEEGEIDDIWSGPDNRPELFPVQAQLRLRNLEERFDGECVPGAE